MRRKNSLKNKEDFQRVFEKADKEVSNYYLIVKWVWRDDNKESLIGIAISKKVKRAVDRNKIKREIRNQIDNYFNLSKPVNIIFIVKLKYLYIDKKEIGEMFYNLISKTPFIKK